MSKITEEQLKSLQESQAKINQVVSNMGAISIQKINLEKSKEAQLELEKIPGFVRGKIKRNTEKYAHDENIMKISLEVMYAAKESVN